MTSHILVNCCLWNLEGFWSLILRSDFSFPQVHLAIVPPKKPHTMLDGSDLKCQTFLRCANQVDKKWQYLGSQQTCKRWRTGWVWSLAGEEQTLPSGVSASLLSPRGRDIWARKYWIYMQMLGKYGAKIGRLLGEYLEIMKWNEDRIEHFYAHLSTSCLQFVHECRRLWKMFFSRKSVKHQLVDKCAFEQNFDRPAGPDRQDVQGFFRWYGRNLFGIFRN